MGIRIGMGVAGASLALADCGLRYRSARDYPDRSGKRQHCDDIRGDCQ